jgi:protein gp37
MGENTKIEWAHHTFNPWYGCTKVSPACDHCYAEGWAKRSGLLDDWGKARQRSSPENWKKPLKWANAAAYRGVRERVFCASLADVFDNQVPAQWRLELFGLIYQTRRSLDWLLLTKRPQNIAKMIDDAIMGDYGGWPWSNVWLGTTVENQEEADRRIPHLLSVPAAVHFLSCEPLLGPVDLKCVAPTRNRSGEVTSFIQAIPNPKDPWPKRYIDWVICGGESGPRARPMHPDWARSLRDQCAAAGVPFFFKQGGEWAECEKGDGGAELIGIDPEIAEHDCAFDMSAAVWMRRVGKKAAGRLLDGREWNEFPKVAT